MFGNKTNRRLEEEEVIKYLINFTSRNVRADLRHFYKLIYDAVDSDEFRLYTGLLIGSNILRTELGFDGNAKPGDFDVIIIPFSSENIFFHRTTVYEVKVVRPTREKPKRNANSLGLTQTKGLIQDGFPLVGLMHVCMTEPLLDSEKREVKHCKHPINIDGVPMKKGTWEDTIDVKIDFFSMAAADNQMKRLVSTDLPKYVGVSAFGLNFYEDGTSALATCSQDFWGFQQGYFNPYTKQETIEKVMRHFLSHKDKYQLRPVR